MEIDALHPLVYGLRPSWMYACTAPNGIAIAWFGQQCTVTEQAEGNAVNDRSQRVVMETIQGRNWIG